MIAGLDAGAAPAAVLFHRQCLNELELARSCMQHAERGLCDAVDMLDYVSLAHYEASTVYEREWFEELERYSWANPLRRPLRKRRRQHR